MKKSIWNTAKFRMVIVWNVYVRCIAAPFTILPECMDEQETPMPDPKTMTKTQRINWNYAADAHRMVEWDIHNAVKDEMGLPPEWAEIWKDEDRHDPKRTLVTIRLDADVVKFFKGMGTGYQARINRVLRMFMHYRLAGLVEGPDTTDYVLRPDDVMLPDRIRPSFGDYARRLAEIKKEMGEG